MLQEKPLPILVIVVLSLLGGMAAYYAMAWGPWAFSDGVGYIVSTRNMLNGVGLGLIKPSGTFEPLVSHPPLYPLVLALATQFTGNVLEASRWVDSIALSALILSVGLLTLKITGSSWAGSTSAALLLVTPALLIAYTSAMAEPLFILCSFTGTLLMVSHVQKPRRAKWTGSALFIGLGIIARYPAIAFLPANLILLIMCTRKTRRSWLLKAAAYSWIVLAPLSAFLIWSFTVREAGSPRALAPQLDLANKLQTFFQHSAGVLWTWKPISPEAVGMVKQLASRLTGVEIFAALIYWLCLLAGIIFLFASKERITSDSNENRPTVLLAVAWISVSFFYIIFFLAIYLGTYPTPDIDTRILLPVQICGVLLFVVLLLFINERWPMKTWAQIGIGVTILLFAGGYFLLAADILSGIHRTGLGYTSKSWRNSETLQAIKDLPEGTPLISNEPMPILLYYHVWPMEIEELSLSQSQEELLPFGNGGTTPEKIFRDGSARLILFDTFESQVRSVYGDRHQERLETFFEGLIPIFTGEDGFIYRYR
jgi:4-amino-4-deoxy-L-arabinose transferase-like glycosyltransferase